MTCAFFFLPPESEGLYARVENSKRWPTREAFITPDAIGTGMNIPCEYETLFGLCIDFETYSTGRALTYILIPYTLRKKNYRKTGWGSQEKLSLEAVTLEEYGGLLPILYVGSPAWAYIPDS